MCTKKLNQEYLNAADAKQAMNTATGREITTVQAFTLVISKQSKYNSDNPKDIRKDFIHPGVPVMVWAEVNNHADFAIRPIIKETGKKVRVEIIDTANVVSMTPLTEFEYDGKIYLRQRVENNHRFAVIKKK